MAERAIADLWAVEKVAAQLGELNAEVLFVGGAVVGLYATAPGAEPPRPTRDVDLSLQIGTYAAMDALRERLAEKRIFPATGEKVVNRFVFEDILIDIIPDTATALGPTNRWLKPGFKQARLFPVGSQVIRILPVALFIASKWEAFNSRGGDPRWSHDFEDLVYIFDNHAGLLEEVRKADGEAVAFLKGMSQHILAHPHRDEILECHLPPSSASQRKNALLELLAEIQNLPDKV